MLTIILTLLNLCTAAHATIPFEFEESSMILRKKSDTPITMRHLCTLFTLGTESIELHSANDEDTLLSKHRIIDLLTSDPIKRIFTILIKAGPNCPEKNNASNTLHTALNIKEFLNALIATHEAHTRASFLPYNTLDRINAVLKLAHDYYNEGTDQATAKLAAQHLLKEALKVETRQPNFYDDNTPFYISTEKPQETYPCGLFVQAQILDTKTPLFLFTPAISEPHTREQSLLKKTSVCARMLRCPALHRFITSIQKQDFECHLNNAIVKTAFEEWQTRTALYIYTAYIDSESIQDRRCLNILSDKIRNSLEQIFDLSPRGGRTPTILAQLDAETQLFLKNRQQKKPLGKTLLAILHTPIIRQPSVQVDYTLPARTQKTLVQHAPQDTMRETPQNPQNLLKKQLDTAKAALYNEAPCQQRGAIIATQTLLEQLGPQVVSTLLRDITKLSKNPGETSNIEPTSRVLFEELKARGADITNIVSLLACAETGINSWIAPHNLRPADKDIQAKVRCLGPALRAEFLGAQKDTKDTPACAPPTTAIATLPPPATFTPQHFLAHKEWQTTKRLLTQEDTQLLNKVVEIGKIFSPCQWEPDQTMRPMLENAMRNDTTDPPQKVLCSIFRDSANFLKSQTQKQFPDPAKIKQLLDQTLLSATLIDIMQKKNATVLRLITTGIANKIMQPCTLSALEPHLASILATHQSGASYLALLNLSEPKLYQEER